MAQKKNKHRSGRAKGMPSGMSYADILAHKRLLKERALQAVDDETLRLMADRQTQRALYLAVISINQAYGIGKKRLPLWYKALIENSNDFGRMVEEADEEYADEKLRQKAEEISGESIKLLYQDEIDAARLKHEAAECEGA